MIPIRLPIGFCSGALRSDIESVITAHNIKENFRTIVTAEDTKKSKPDPAPYQLALKNLKIIEPANAVAIEIHPRRYSLRQKSRHESSRRYD